MVLPLDWGSSTNSSTSPTTIGPSSSNVCTSSSSSPTRTRAACTSSGVVPGTSSTYSASQLSGTRMSDHHSELLGEADVSLDHFAHVLHVVAEHETPLDAHAEREPGVHLGVDAGRLEHVGVHHAAAAPFDPARAALESGVPEVELSARLGEREEARPQADLRLVAEDRLHEVVEGALEVRHREPLVDGDALELHEDGQVRRVELVGAVDPPRREHVERQLALEHRTDLHQARVRAQHEVRLGRV